MEPTREIARATAVAALAALLACSPGQELGFSYIPPVLSFGLDLESTDVQRREFEFGRSGRHELGYRLTLRHGPGSSPHPQMLVGRVEIRDAEGRPRLEHPFEEELAPDQIAGIFLSFDSGDLAGRGPYSLSITLERQSPGLIERYTDLLVYLRRTPAFPILD